MHCVHLLLKWRQEKNSMSYSNVKKIIIIKKSCFKRGKKKLREASAFSIVKSNRQKFAYSGQKHTADSTTLLQG